MWWTSWGFIVFECGCRYTRWGLEQRVQGSSTGILIQELSASSDTQLSTTANRSLPDIPKFWEERSIICWLVAIDITVGLCVSCSC